MSYHACANLGSSFAALTFVSAKFDFRGEHLDGDPSEFGSAVCEISKCKYSFIVRISRVRIISVFCAIMSFSECEFGK